MEIANIQKYNQKIVFQNNPHKNPINSLTNFNVIYFNGIAIPRLPFSNSRYKPDKSNKNAPNIVIELNESLGDEKENENQAAKNDNSEAIFSKKTSHSDINKYDENHKDKNNIFIKSISYNQNNQKEGKNNNNNIGNIIINNNKINCNQNLIQKNKRINDKQKTNEINENIINYNEKNILNESTEKKENNNDFSDICLNEFSIDNPFILETKKVKPHKPLCLFKVEEALSPIDEKENQEQNNFLIKKRGRKQKNINKRIHCATDDDNMQRKIQVHYITFITNFINDIIKTFTKSKNVPLFKKIDYQLKKVVNHKYFNYIKTQNIGQILQMKPSPKLKMNDISVNKTIYNKICKILPFMEDYLKKDYRSLFKEYFSNNNNVFIVNDKTIALSEKTKTFKDLINKNYAYKEKLKFVALHYFLDIDKNPNVMKFLTETEKKE